MRWLLPILTALLLALPAPAQELEKPAQAKKPARVEFLPGVELARGISELTGVAISPLLGVSSVGAWRYVWTSAEERARLPWFCHPAFWGAGYVLLGLCFLKDSLGAAAPPLLKKPLDVIELFENKLSALVACSAFLPFIVSQFAVQGPAAPEALAHGANLPLATMAAAFPLDARLVIVPLAMIGFLAVWLTSHAINVLIALCPFGLIDAGLKLFRAAVLSLLTAASFLSPFLGAVISLAIVAIALVLAPWAFRLTVFGTVFGLDVLLPWRGRRRIRLEAPHAFLAQKLGGAPVRSYGRIVRQGDGAAAFAYRPWLILPEQTVPLTRDELCIAKGLLFPSLHQPCPRRGRTAMAVMLLPRYRSHEEQIARHFGLAEVQESPLRRGLLSVRIWFAEMLRGRSAASETP
jgi:hypothetical protein